MNNQKLLSKKPQEIGDIISNSLRLYMKSLIKVFPIAGIYAILSLLPKWLFQWLDVSTYTEIIISCILYVPALFFFAILVYQINDILQQRNINTKLTLSTISQLFVNFILSILLYYAMVLVGIVLLIIPGFYLAVALSFSFILVIIDKIKPLESIRQSYYLVYKNWWRTVAVFISFIFISLALFIILFAVTEVLNLILNLPLLILNNLSIGNPKTSAMLISAILSLFMTTCLAPLPICFILVQCYDLKIRYREKYSKEKVKTQIDA